MLQKFNFDNAKIDEIVDDGYGTHNFTKSYFIKTHGIFPYCMSMNDDEDGSNVNYLVKKVLDKIIKKFPGATVVWAQGDIVKGGFQKFTVRLRPELYLYFSGVKHVTLFDKYFRNKKLTGKHFVTESIDIYYSITPELSDISVISKIIKECKVTTNEDNKINFITRRYGEFEIRDYNITFDNSNEALDLHYGKDFEDYYKKLKKLIVNNTKGLILLYGVPGCLHPKQKIKVYVSRTKDDKKIKSI